MKQFIFILVLAFIGHGSEKLNYVFMMTDDQGYGDTGFNGHKIIKTPHLDQMAKEGAKLTQFYAGGPVCSPTRGTYLTGRHYYRYGIWGANVGHLPKEEITLARVLKQQGYVTGHFGKWHLGTLNKDYSTKGESRKPTENFAPPWERDYDESFVVESSVSTWDPASEKNPFYINGVPMKGTEESLYGGAARVVVDKAIPFMERAVSEGNPFLAVVWFNAPHEPIKAGPKYLEMYKEHGEAAHYYGCLTEMDEQVGRIRAKLREMGVEKNTVLFFCSDNGPEGKEAKGAKAGTTSGLRGRKRSLYEGGVRVPALAEWPGKIQAGSVIDAAMSTLDYLPTVIALQNYQMPDERPLDGENILALLTSEESQRKRGIPFIHRGKAVLNRGDYKLVYPKELYALSNDWSEENNIASQYPEIVAEMSKELEAFVLSMKESHAGADYGLTKYKALDPWSGVKGIAEATAENSKSDKLKKRADKNKKRNKKNKKNSNETQVSEKQKSAAQNERIDI